MSHEFEGTAYSGDGDTIIEQITGAEWDGWPLRVFTHEEIMSQDGIVNYVWPDEGEWRNGKWRFHKGNRPADEDGKEPVPYPTTPMMIDGSSARAYQVCYPTMNEKNQRSCRERVESRRWWAGYIISEVFWPSVSYGGRG